MKLNKVIIALSIICFFGTSVLAKEEWKYIHSRNVGENQNIFFINTKNIKRRDNLLSFSIYKQIKQLAKDDVTTKKEGDTTFDMIQDKIVSELGADVNKSKTECVIDCENSLVLNMNTTYYQDSGKVAILDIYNNIISVDGKTKELPESLKNLRGWKPIGYYKDYENIFQKYCKPVYKRKDLKTNVEF